MYINWLKKPPKKIPPKIGMFLSSKLTCSCADDAAYFFLISCNNRGKRNKYIYIYIYDYTRQSKVV